MTELNYLPPNTKPQFWTEEQIKQAIDHLVATCTLGEIRRKQTTVVQQQAIAYKMAHEAIDHRREWGKNYLRDSMVMENVYAAAVDRIVFQEE